MKQRKVPARMCVTCRQMKPKRELVRVVRAPEGGVSVDPVGKKPGRGAYVCLDRACIEKARKQRRIERAFAGEDCSALYPELLALADARLEAEAEAAAGAATEAVGAESAGAAGAGGKMAAAGSAGAAGADAQP